MTSKLPGDGALSASPRHRRDLAAMTFGLAVFYCLMAGTAVAQMALPGQLSVNDTGAAVYTIPIAVPPGTAGMQPKLSLDYNSRGGNGILGVGWSLSGLPAITRCGKTIAQDGTSGGIAHDANDRFCLEGDRLVAVSGAYGADGAEYRFEREGFSKIVSYGTAGTGPAWFKVWTKSGQIMEFGNTADSRIEAQGKTTARLWTINNISDTAGNYMTVSYTEDNPNGDYLPARIDYTGNAVAGTAPYASVRFGYGPRPEITPLYEAGSVIKTTQRLTHITTHVGETLVSDYRVAYGTSPSTQRSRVASVTMCDGAVNCLPATSLTWQDITHGFTPVYSSQFGNDWISWPSARVLTGDWNGDGRTDIAVSAYQLGGIGYYISNGDGTFTPGFSSQPGSDWISWPDSNPTRVFTGDWNGDGKTDIGVTAPGMIGLGTYLSGGNGPFQAVYSPHTGADWIGHSDARLIFGDWNGDGKTDIAVSKPNFGGIAYYISNGNGQFTAGFGSQTGTDWISGSNVNAFGADLNGDGRTDIVAYGHGLGGIAYYFSKGDGTFTGGYSPQTGTDWTSLSGARVVAGDWNGDGKTDLAVSHTGISGIGVYLSRGEGNFAANHSLQTGQTGSDWINWPNARVITGDWNGDGRTDIAVSAYQLGGVGYYMSQGDGQFIAGYSGQFGNDWVSWPDSNPTRILTGDWNGDGKTDIAVSSTGLGGIGSYLATPTNGAVPDVLTVIASGVGAATTISYESIAENGAPYTRESTTLFPVVDIQAPLDAQAAIHVVSEIQAPNGVNGTPYRTTYRYVGAKAHAQGRGFLGFRQMVARDEQTGIEQTTTYRQDWPYVGLPSLRTKVLSASGVELNRVESSYAATAQTPATTPSRSFVTLTQSVESSKELSGVAMPTVTTSYSYDAYGNATAVTVSTGDGYSKVTTNTYTNDVANWLLGRLTRAVVQSATP